MMRIKQQVLAMVLCGLAALTFTCDTAMAKDAPFSVNASEIEYDIKSGDGLAIGKVTIVQDGSKTTAGGGGTFNSKNKTGHLRGGVESERGDEKLKSNELVLHNENYVSAIGNAHITKADKTLNAAQVDYYKDREYAETIGPEAELTATDGSWLTASKITYDIKGGVANATGGVSLASPPRALTGRGDSAVYTTSNDGYIELIGNAKAVQDGNTVTGNRLKITNTNARASAEGNVRIVYIPKQEEKPAMLAVAQNGHKGEKTAITGHDKAKAKINGTNVLEVA